jgi:hypothetical protein
MRVAVLVVGVVLLLMGLVFVLQGMNIIPGSFMTGQLFWVQMGAITMTVGVILIYATLRRRRRLQ